MPKIKILKTNFFAFRNEMKEFKRKLPICYKKESTIKYNIL